ncbi:tetratricopeptide repeat protein 14-like isoform X3 [Eriocheir sinensis]|uniref:tetratricopeptide repeat protein 14-like isoform X3 n=1 Tax=Eriocheir sinensis TaxID=95602 RepID=UPI0021C9A423|nr:tetratricopeptide repeat protein 14-like isoform X3 [Eriocheir sinensis]
MAGTDPLSSKLVTQSVNFHGHLLLKQLTSSHSKDVESLNMKEVNYKIYRARNPEISKQPTATRNELISFISDKCTSLFVPRESKTIVDNDDDDFGFKDRSNSLPPLEHFMKIMCHLKKDIFFKKVQRGDVLYGRVATHVHDLLCIVKVQAAVGPNVRDLFDADIKAHLRLEDSDPEPADTDDLGRWMLRTRLCVEVLEVDASDNYLLVGTKGVAIPPHLKDKIKLGKVTLGTRPPIVSVMEEQNIKSYAHALEKLKTFNNPRSIRHLAGKFNISLSSHSSLMDSLKYKFPDREMYRSVRKSQMSRWAHKSVADGVVFFKRGQHEEAFQCLNKALQIDNENVEAFVAKGALLANFGSLEKAVENFEEALKYNPTHNNAQKYICETLVELGKQYEEENKIEEAEKSFKKCLSINPDHEAGKESIRKLIQKNDLGPKSPEVVEDAIQDLIDIEVEFKRKRHRTNSSSKSSPVAKKETPATKSESREAQDSKLSSQSRSPSKSLSPLSTKMEMQEGKWQPPSTINTTTSFIPNLAVPPPNIESGFSYPPPGWPPTTVVVAPPVTTIYQPPPTTYPVLPQPQGLVVSGSTYTSREDEEYKARVDKFLKDIEGVRSGEKKDHSKKKHSRSRESRSRKKHKDSHKKRNRNTSSSSASRSSSYSSSSSSHSKSSSRSSSSSTTSSSTSHNSSGSIEESRKKKHKKYKKQKKTNRKEKKKPQKHQKKEIVKEKPKIEVVKEKPKIEVVKEKPKSKIHHITAVEDDPIPGLESLNEKLSAYYKKVEESQREQPNREKKSKEMEPQAKEREKKSKEREPQTKERSENLDSITQMMEVMNRYKQGFRLTSKTKVVASSSLTTKGVHPAFQESDEEDVLDLLAANASSKKKKKAEPENDNTGVPEVIPSTILEPSDSPNSKKSGRSSTSQSYQRNAPKDHSRSHSRSRHSRSRSRSKSRSRRHSKSRSRDRYSDHSRSLSRERSRSPYRRYSRSRSRSRSRSNYNVRYNSGRPFRRGRMHSYQRPRSRDRGDYYQEGFQRHRPYHHRTRSPRHHSNWFRGRGRPGGRRGGGPFRGGRGNWEKRDHHKGRESPEPLSEQEREMMIEAARKKVEASIKYGAADPVDGMEPNRDDSSHSKTQSKSDSYDSKSPNRAESSCPKTPCRWESSHPKTPSRWESSRPKTPSRWESSRPKTPSRWDAASRPKTPSRWDSSHPKTPGRWESSRPKTPSRWDSSRPKTPSRWESSRPKTPSRWESSRPKTPSRWESSRPKTPSRWESSRPKTPSRWESSRPKTPSRWETSCPKTPSTSDPQKQSKGESLPKILSPGSPREIKNERIYDDKEDHPHISDEESPDRTARFGKWDTDEKGKNGEAKIGNSLTEMETFIEVAKQKKMEEMKERNKAFLKPTID